MMNYTQEDLMQKLAKYEELRIKNETKGLTSMVKSACKRMSYDCKSYVGFQTIKRHGSHSEKSAFVTIFCRV